MLFSRGGQRKFRGEGRVQTELGLRGGGGGGGGGFFFRGGGGCKRMYVLAYSTGRSG